MKISVIIPTYNRGQLIKETINSVLSQSFKDFEVLVIDDGSTDDTARILAPLGDRIRYVRQPNGGVNNARNHGLALAQGEYIALLDDDDLWLPDKLAIQTRILDRFPEVAYTYSNFSIYRDEEHIRQDGIQSWFERPVDWGQFFDRAMAVQDVSKDLTEHVPGTRHLYFGQIYHASLNHYYVLPSTSLIRRSCIPDGMRLAEHDAVCGDWDFFARLSRNSTVAYLDYETTYNRSHEDEVRITRTAWKEQLQCRIDMLERVYLQDEAFYAEHGKEVDAAYCSRLYALVRQQLMDGERDDARTSLRKLRPYETGLYIPYHALYLASYLPATSGIFRLLRSMRP